MPDAFPLNPPPARWRLHCLLLFLIVAAGTALRFTLLKRPPLWGDESLVYWRICGSYTQLLDCLRTDGFAPLHYELAWALSRHFKPTPFALRLTPTICGSLTIPAVYFFARQLLDRRAALLAALLTAFSAFGFVYARDAKMYADLWLFGTLNIGCLTWWLRTRRFTAWLGFVAAGCLAGGIHFEGLLFPALSPIFLLTSRRPRWTDALWLTAALLLIALGPAGYYGAFNQWAQRVDEYGWNASGLQWTDRENEGRTGLAMVRSALTSLMYGWTYPIPSVQAVASARAFAWLSWSGVVLAITLLLGVLPWPRRWRPVQLESPAQPPWRSLLWLSLLIVPAGYVFYCHSMPDFAGPADWAQATFDALPNWLQSTLQYPAVWAVAGLLLIEIIVGSLLYPPTRRLGVRALQVGVIVGLLLATCEAIHLALTPMALDAQLADRSWHSLWVPRYLGFLWPPLTVVTAVLLLRLPTKTFRVIAITLLVSLNVALIGRRVFASTEPPVDRMAADVFAAQPQDAHIRTYTNLTHGDPNPGGGDLFSTPGRYYLQQLRWKQPMSPMMFYAVLFDYQTYAGYSPGRITQDVKNTPRLDRVVTWDSFSPTGSVTNIANLALPTEWRKVDERVYPVTAYWDWKPRMNYVRREYVKAAGMKS